MKNLTIEQIIFIHDQMIQRFGGGEPGIFPEGNGKLGSMLERMNTHVYGYDPFEDLITKAAFMFQSILQYHPFIDGTKRTGISATYDFLLLNNCILESRTKKESVDFAIRVADVLCQQDPDESLKEIIAWFRNRTHNILDLDFAKKMINKSDIMKCMKCKGRFQSMDKPFCRDCAQQLIRIELHYNGITVKKSVRLSRELIKSIYELHSPKTKFKWDIEVIP